MAANVNVVHGIDGRDLGLPQSLPVDIAVNGTCALKGVTFKQSAVVELRPADYTVTVHQANGSCSQAAVITKRFTIPNDSSSSFSAVASLDNQGTPQLAIFNNSRELVIPPSVTVRHLAKAGPVFVKYSSRELPRSQVSRIRNGRSATLAVLTSRLPYTATIFTRLGRNAVARLTGVERKRFTIINLVGSQANGFTIITERLATQ
jgi:hypothetical protein